MQYNTESIRLKMRIPMEITIQSYNALVSEYCYFLHIQNSVEVLAPIQGCLDAYVNGTIHRISPGQMVVMNPYDQHSGKCGGCESVTYYCLTFDPGYYMSCLAPEAAERLNAINQGEGSLRTVIDDPALSAMLPLLLDLQNEYTPLSESRFAARIYMLLVELLGCHYSDSPAQRGRDFTFIREVSTYVDEHYREPLTTASISAALSWCESYFCRRFRECFGTTFIDYLNRRRVEAAARLRGKPGLSLTDIAGLVGFSDYAWFSRTFSRQKGVSPRAYFGK